MDDPDSLESWKEIAHFIGRDERTAMRWAARGMPVRRVPGGKRGRVFASREEISRWLDGGPNGAAAGKARLERHEPAPTRSGRLRLLGIGAVVFAAVLGILAYRLVYSLPFPVTFRYRQLTNDGYLKSDLLTDGSRVYFVESRGEGNVIAEIPAAGGPVVPVSTFFRDPHLLAINPGLAEIVVSDRPTVAPGALWILPLGGGEPQRLAAIDSNAAALSPDGSTIAYAKGNELWLSKMDGSDDRKIATLPGSIAWISWPSDSNLLRISLDRAPAPGSWIWQVRDDGSDLREVQTGDSNDRWYARGRWGPDREFLLKTNDTPAGPGALWLFLRRPRLVWGAKNLEIRIPTGPLRLGGFASSPIPGTVFVEAGVQHCQFERYDSQSKQFVPFLRGVSGEELSFSPNGQSVAYVSAPPNNLVEENLATGSQVPLTLPPLDTELPRYSPEGKWIAFMGREADGKNWHVYLMPARGGEYRRVTKASQSEGAPTWSPDGTTLAFGDVGDPAGPPSSRSQIHLFNLKTGKEVDLPGSQGLWSARWSPDGRHIAAVTVDSHWLMNFSFRTRRWTKLAGGKDINDLDWSRNGNSIYFLDGVGPNGETISAVSLLDRHVKRIASLKDLESTTGWMGLTPNGSPLVAREQTPTEIYAILWQRP